MAELVAAHYQHHIEGPGAQEIAGALEPAVMIRADRAEMEDVKAHAQAGEAGSSVTRGEEKTILVVDADASVRLPLAGQQPREMREQARSRAALSRVTALASISMTTRKALPDAAGLTVLRVTGATAISPLSQAGAYRP